ncbi:Oxidative stress-induced growth inhibitor 1 [Desmophyllum pertusum]|uniref:Oxidative stress-induced growth inhibitor 1 n=1 Tax=Desmophyllum pertusum TaxID=174260 RepID=A0A9X0D674_9CNID|nr:Oxidative stress-induced growth inhibitor 1 [Desmophyllum pertusum]
MPELFVVHAYNVVLATGNSIPKVLGIPGENLPFVYHQMDVIDRNGKDPKVIYNQLPGVVYPEYYKVGQMIKGDVTTAYGKDALYTAHTKTSLVEIRKDKECILKKADGTLFKQKVSNVLCVNRCNARSFFLTWHQRTWS